MKTEVKGFLISDLLAAFWGCKLLFQSHFCQGTAPFDVMTVLACLSSQTTVTTCTYMRPHGQSFSLRSKSIISVWTGSGRIKQKKRANSGRDICKWSDQVLQLGRQRTEMLTGSLQQQQDPGNHTENPLEVEKETPRLVKQERSWFKFSRVKSLKWEKATLAERQSCLNWISLYGQT